MASAAPAPDRTNAELSPVEGWWARHFIVTETAYWGLHAACLLGLWWTPGAGDLALLAVTFFARMFGITAGYHRYFAHRTFRTGRGFQLLLAALGCSAIQKGPLWWPGHHRVHHAHSDQPGLDLHSPVEGLWYAHQGWVFDRRWDATPIDGIRDFARFPELVWLNRWHPVPGILLAAACYAIGGFSGLLWGFVVSTVLLWHATYTINSLAHVWGSRRYDTPDTSRNNPWLALLTMGEGWHNNHHHYCASTRQGFRWWEIDVTYYLLRGFQALGLIWDIREPPAHVVRGESRAPLRDAA